MAETTEPSNTQAYFLTAAALETVFALNALLYPERRRFTADWAADVTAQLTEEEQGWVETLRRLPERLIVGDIAVQRGCLQDTLDLSAVVADMDPREFVAQFLEGLVKPDQVPELQTDPAAAAARLRRQHPWLWGGDEELIRLILAEGALLQTAHARLLPRIWEIGVKPMLPKLTPLWEATIEQAQAEAEGKDPKTFAITVFSKPFGRRFGPDHIFAKYLFVPTYFFSPMRGAFTEFDTALLTLDCRLGPWAVAAARGKILEGLRALAEENRLEILRLLTIEKGFGGWVAGRLKLNPATVTHHIAQLRKAGLIDEAEGPPGAAKYFKTDREAIRRLITLLENYLDGNMEPDWGGEKP